MRAMAAWLDSKNVNGRGLQVKVQISTGTFDIRFLTKVRINNEHFQAQQYIDDPNVQIMARARSSTIRTIKPGLLAMNQQMLDLASVHLSLH